MIGGHMVTVLAARWQLGHDLYQETGDVDLGIPPLVVRDHNLVSRLKDLNYVQIAGNRFARGLADIPAGTKDTGGWRSVQKSPCELTLAVSLQLLRHSGARDETVRLIRRNILQQVLVEALG